MVAGDSDCPEWAFNPQVSPMSLNDPERGLKMIFEAGRRLREPVSMFGLVRGRNGHGPFYKPSFDEFDSVGSILAHRYVIWL